MSIETINRNFSQGPNVSKGLVEIAYMITEGSFDSAADRQKACEDYYQLVKKTRNHPENSSII